MTTIAEKHYNLKSEKSVQAMGSTSLVSIIMPVFNGEKYIEDSVNSMLNQSYNNFEFIIVDDGSSDGSIAIINKFSDPRIKIISNSSNQGISKALNKALQQSRGKYVARMDCDDVSLSSRIKLQVEYLNENPAVDIVGTQAMIINAEADKKINYRRLPLSHWEIGWELFFRSPIVHSSIMFRKSIVKNNVFYNPNTKISQDRELWQKLFSNYNFANLSKILIELRKRSGSNFNNNNLESESININLTKGYIEKYMKTEITSEIFNSYVKFKYKHQILSKTDVQNIYKMLILLFNIYTNENNIAEQDRIIILNNCSDWLVRVSKSDGRIEREKYELLKNLIKLIMPSKFFK